MKRALALLALALLAACTNPTPQEEPSATEAAPSVSLQQLREEHGLPECPETDSDAEQESGGLPQTALPCLGTDQSVNLAGLPRQAMVVNFWAQWCPPCRKEAPYLRAMSEAHDDITFVGVNYTDPQPALAIEFAGESGWAYPHVVDEEKELQRSIGVPGLPMTLFIDADGVIQHRHAGVFESEEQLGALIEEYL